MSHTIAKKHEHPTPALSGAKSNAFAGEGGGATGFHQRLVQYATCCGPMVPWYSISCFAPPPRPLHGAVNMFGSLGSALFAEPPLEGTYDPGVHHRTRLSIAIDITAYSMLAFGCNNCNTKI